MLKVLLIDDEAVILYGLKKLIDWEMLGFEIIAEARDGKQGLELIEEKKPDIVISDIAMPNFSGIDLIKEIKQRELKVKTILLSGYQEFAYAREAVRYGAVDYLLKPVSPEELAKILTNVAESIASENSYHRLKKRDSKVELLTQEILQKKREDTALSDIGQVAGIPIEYAGATAVGIRILWKKEIVNSKKNLRLITFDIYEFIEKYLEQCKLGCMIERDYSACYCMITGDNDRIDLKKRVLMLVKEVRKNYPVELIAGVGGWENWNDKLYNLYKTAKFALELYYFEEKLYIDYEAITKEFTHSLEEYDEMVKKLTENMSINYNSPMIVDNILECVTLLGNIHYGNKSTVVNSCIVLAGEIYSTLQSCGLLDESYIEEQTEFLEEVRRRTTFKSMCSYFREYYEKIFLKIRLLCGRKETLEIARIKSYIGEHFTENITLEDIASYIGMNTSYMSVFFKKATGENFKAYLTKVRMKEALRLLMSTDMKSYELAAAIGYRDDKQFREKFKEMYGLSPQQYRKQKI
ncbi:MAG: response regulator [bacterium]|nr:response regulator [bacterium]